MTIQPPAIKVYVWLIFLGVLLPLLITLGSMMLIKESTSSKINFLVIVAVLLPMIIVVTFIALRRDIGIDRDGMRIAGAFYTVSLKFPDIDGNPRQLINELDKQPILKTNGISLMGLHIGWFKLRNGEKCFMYVTDDHPVYIQTKRGFSLQLSVRSADELAAGIQEGRLR